jgi:hypothetical protein
MSHYKFAQTDIRYNTKSDPYVNYGCWVTMMSHCWFIMERNVALRVDVDGGSYAGVGAGVHG